MSTFTETNPLNTIYVFKWATLKGIRCSDAKKIAEENNYPDMYGDGGKEAFVMTDELIAQQFSQKFGVGFQTEHV